MRASPREPGRRARLDLAGLPRVLLRACGAGVVLVAACAGGAPTGAPAKVPSEASRAPRSLSLVPARAEVWAWEVDVHGAAADEPGAARLVACHVVAGDVRSDAKVREGRFEARVRLRPGRNVARATCTDERHREHRSAEAELVAMLRDTPTARLSAELRGGELHLDAAASSPSGGSEAPIVGYEFTTDPKGAAVTAEGPRARAPLPSGDGTFGVRVVVRDARGRTDASTVRLVTEAGRRTLVDARGSGGPTARDAVVYGVFPPVHGEPPLEAVRRELPDFERLGVTTLWLAPIFETVADEYGYAVTDYFRVRPDYGTERDLGALVAEAHRRGLRVLLDMVPNHTSAKHRYFREAEALGPASHYYGFYQRDEHGAPVHYFDWEHLPNLEYRSAEVTRFMLEASAHWVRDWSVDGYRVDAAWGVRERAPAFWDAFRTEVRRISPDALLVAEASARDPFYVEHGFDAAYDWTHELGKAAWEHVFDDPAQIADRLHDAVMLTRTRALRFLENNDTGPRFVTRHGPAVTRVAAAALLTLPGIPCLFSGQERGAEYEPYGPRTPLPTTDVHGLRPWYTRLTKLRRATRALREDGYTRLATTPRAGVLAYARHDAAWNEVAFVILRFDERGGPVTLTLPEDHTPPRGNLTDALAARPASVRFGATRGGPPSAGRSDTAGRGATGSSVVVDVGPYSAAVLVPTTLASSPTR